jgi:hypothetical protein
LPLRKSVEPAGKAIGHEQIDPDERSLEVHLTNGSLCEWRRTPSSNYRRWRGSQLLIGITGKQTYPPILSARIIKWDRDYRIIKIVQ